MVMGRGGRYGTGGAHSGAGLFVSPALAVTASAGAGWRHREGVVEPPALTALMARQHGVVTTDQCRQLGVSHNRVLRMVASGRWRTLHRGVHVTYSGGPSWRTRAMAALLHAGVGAALSHQAAAYLHDFTARPPLVIPVVVPWSRHPEATRGVVVRRRRVPPRVVGVLMPRTDRSSTVLDLVAISRTDDDAVGWLTAAVRARTGPGELCRALAGRPRQRRRGLVLDLLGEVADGVESPMERRYHRDVERAHGLPPSKRQGWERLEDGWIRSDCRYEGLSTRVELGHPGGRTAADTWRDNEVVLTHGELTLRYRWVHVLDPCRTAAQVVRALRRGGWRDEPRRCSPTCTLS